MPHPFSTGGDFLPASQQRQHWFSELRITPWVRSVVFSYTASVWDMSVPDIILGEKTLLTHMDRYVLGWKRERRGTKQAITWRFIELNHQHTNLVMAYEANSQCCRAQHSTFQDWHEAALTSIYHGQLPTSSLARGGELSHQKNNTQFPLHSK